MSDGRSKSPSLTMLATGKTSFKTSLAFHYSDIHWQSPASAVAIIDGAPGYSLPPRGRLAKNEPPHYLHGGKPPVNVSLKASASTCGGGAGACGAETASDPMAQAAKPPVLSSPVWGSQTAPAGKSALMVRARLASAVVVRRPPSARPGSSRLPFMSVPSPFIRTARALTERDRGAGSHMACVLERGRKPRSFQVDAGYKAETEKTRNWVEVHARAHAHAQHDARRTARTARRTAHDAQHDARRTTHDAHAQHTTHDAHAHARRTQHSTGLRSGDGSGF